MSDTDMILLTEKCTARNCGTRVRYGELTDDENTHWHVRAGVALVPADDDLAAKLGACATVGRTLRGQVDGLRAELEALANDFQANGNSRELGDPTADAWQSAAFNLLRVLDRYPKETTDE